MLAGDLVHQIHHYLILVIGQICLPEDRSELELIWRHLIVPGLERDPEAMPRDLKVTHELCHPGRDGSEIMVVQLLVF